MDEHVSAVERFTDDLSALGVAHTQVVKAIGLYVDALFRPSMESWSDLYRHVSQTLQQWPGRPVSVDAAQRLYALMDDDLGRRVLEAPVRARLREAMFS